MAELSQQKVEPERVSLKPIEGEDSDNLFRESGKLECEKAGLNANLSLLVVSVSQKGRCLWANKLQRREREK